MSRDPQCCSDKSCILHDPFQVLISPGILGFPCLFSFLKGSFLSPGRLFQFTGNPGLVVPC